MPDPTMTPLPDAPESVRVHRNVRIHHTAGKPGGVFVDDLDISRTVTRYNANCRAGQIPEVTVWLLPGELLYDGAAEVRVDERTAEALLALGWTPPSETTTNDRRALAARFHEFLSGIHERGERSEATPAGLVEMAERLANVVVQHNALRAADQ